MSDIADIGVNLNSKQYNGIHNIIIKNANNS